MKIKKHLFCEECINEWLNRQNNNCPNCRKELNINQLTNPIPIMLRMISNLQIKCIRNKKGCDKVLYCTINEIKKHENECDYNIIKCPYNCNNQMKLKELEVLFLWFYFLNLLLI